jgi:hypothetical protein
MQFVRHALARLNMPYPLGTISLHGVRCVVAATEDSGPILLARPPFQEAREMVDGPGGCMALVEDENRPGELFAIMGCFLGYKFQTGGIYAIRPTGRPAGPDAWTSERILELPFAHRIAFVERAGTRWLVAARLAADKRDPSDWSQPGSLSASRVPRRAGEKWELAPILEGIHRHHGMLLSRFMGKPSLMVSGTEGLFATDLSHDGGAWTFEKVLSQEISEIALVDVDGDGADELVTIEPFHGNALRIYRQEAGRWQKVWEGALEFGHCLWAGTLGGVPSIMASSRAGSRDLLLLRWDPRSARSGSLADPERIVVEAGAGAANMLVLKNDGVELIFATSQAAGEVVCYRPVE